MAETHLRLPERRYDVHLRSAYYEKTLKGKTLRDEESGMMLDLIVASRVYDVRWYHLSANYNGLVMNLLRNCSNTFASMYASSEKLAALSVSRTNDTFLALKDKFRSHANGNIMPPLSPIQIPSTPGG